MLVEWKGFTAADNSWEDLVTLLEDVPVLVANYARKLKSENHELCDSVLETIEQKS